MSRTGASSARTRVAPAAQPPSTDPIPSRAVPLGEGAAAARSWAQLRRLQPERRSCSDFCLAFSGLQRGLPTPFPTPTPEARVWSCAAQCRAAVHIWKPTASPDLLCNPKH